MLRLLVNFFGGAFVFMLELGGAALLPALLVEGVREAASLGAFSDSIDGVSVPSGIDAGCTASADAVFEVFDGAMSVEAGLSSGTPFDSAVDVAAASCAS
jgi:hypothetical protein